MLLNEENVRLNDFGDGMDIKFLKPSTYRMPDFNSWGFWGSRDTPAQAIKKIAYSSSYDEDTKLQLIDKELERLQRVVTAPEGSNNFNILRKYYPNITFRQYLKRNLEEEGIYDSDEVKNLLGKSNFLYNNYNDVWNHFGGDKIAYPLNPPNATRVEVVNPEVPTTSQIPQEDYDKLRTSYDILQSTSAEQITQLQSLSDENAKLTSQISSLSASIKELQERRSSDQNNSIQIKKLTSRLLELETQLSNNKTHINELISQNNINKQNYEQQIQQQAEEIQRLNGRTLMDFIRESPFGQQVGQVVDSLGGPYIAGGIGILGTILISMGLYKAAKAWREYKAKKNTNNIINNEI